MLLSMWDSVFDLLTVSVIFVVIIALTYFTTRFIAGYQKGKSVSRNIEVVETYRVTTGKYIQIVRTGDKYLAIGIGKDEIHVLAELSGDRLKLSEQEAGSMPSFKDFLDMAKHRKDKKQ